jgi:chemotaxis response regulator CheB
MGRWSVVMANRNVLAVGTSAGGVEALISLAKHLRSDFPAAVLVTIHLSSHSRSVLDEILSRAGPLPARFAVNGENIRKSHIYIAPLIDICCSMAIDWRWAQGHGKTMPARRSTRCYARSQSAAVPAGSVRS